MEMELATTAIMTSIEWIWDKFATPFIEQGKGKINEKWKQFDWKRAEDLYRASIIESCGRIRITGMSKEIQLGAIFTDVYILDKPSAYHRYDISSLMEQNNPHSPSKLSIQKNVKKRYEGTEIVKEGHNLYILGKPGAGKTTFLKYLAIQGANHKFADKLPIFISLHEWANSEYDELLPFIVQQFDICHFPEAELFIDYLLVEGKGLMLFDGLDEVRREDNRRQTIIRNLQSFIRKYDSSQHLITCRIAASEFSFDSFWDVEVADFTEAQILAYTNKWFRDSQIKRLAFNNEMINLQNKGLYELCLTPLLLSLICIYFDENMLFPERRVELYEDAINTLLRKWDSRRNIQRDTVNRVLTYKRKEQMLAHVAAFFFDQGEYYFKKRHLLAEMEKFLARLPMIDPDEEIDGDTILNLIVEQHGLLVERAAGIYSFSHLTIHEYFTSRYIVDNEARGATKALVKNGLIDKRWHEVFLLVASILDDGEEFIHIMIKETRNIFCLNQTLVSMSKWSKLKLSTTSKIDTLSPKHIYKIYMAYFMFAIALARVNSIDLSIKRVNSRIHQEEEDLTKKISISLDDSLVDALELARLFARGDSLSEEIDISSEAVLTVLDNLSKRISVQIGIDYCLYYLSSYIKFTNKNLLSYESVQNDFHVIIRELYVRLLSMCKECNEVELYNGLQCISFPENVSAQSEWNSFGESIVHLANTYREHIFDWALNFDDVDLLDQYFYASELAIKCFELVSIKSRSRLWTDLLPTGQ